MKNIITTMPISVSENPKLSLWVAPYVAKLIEKHTVLQGSVLAINLLWQKVEGIDEELLRERLERFKSQLTLLGIPFENFWVDKDNIKSLLSIIDSLKEKWLIHEEDVTVKICSCGIYETLANAWNFWSKKRIQSNKTCSKCGTEACEKQLKWLMYTIMDNDYDVYPQRYVWHINNYKTNYSKILISRERNTWVKYNWYNIDIDFLWSMWLVDLRKKGYQPEIVLTNPSWLYNTYIAISIYNALEKSSIIPIVHPYIWVNSKNKGIDEKWLKHENYSLDNIIQNNWWAIMQILLASWLKWWEDYSKIDESAKKVIWRLLNTMKVGKTGGKLYEYNMKEIDDLLKTINWKNILNAIAGRIWNRLLTLENQQEVLNNFII